MPSQTKIVHTPEVVEARRNVKQSLYKFEHHLSMLADRIDRAHVIAVGVPLAKLGWRAFRVARRTPLWIFALGSVAGGVWVYKKLRATKAD